MFLDFLSYIYNSFLDLIYNKKCLICSCSKTDNLLCKNCAKDVKNLSFFPQKIYKEIPFYSAAHYEGNIKKLIHILKFHHKKSAAKVLAKILFEYFTKLELKEEFIISYVPAYYTKRAQRGYDHMFLIAKEFSKLTGMEINKNLIKKIKFTKPQYQAKNRFKNIEGSFKINKINTEKTILLLDDIITTGATLETIINCFEKENVKNIVCLTVSKAC